MPKYPQSDPLRELVDQNDAKRLKEEKTALLPSFGVPGLSLGKPEINKRCPCEQYGLYDKDKRHLGDLAPQRYSRFSSEEFRSAVEFLLLQNRLK